MARLARAEVFCPSEVAVIHVINRCVRRCFLMGEDPVSGKNFDHRKQWLENRLHRMAACFGIDLLCYSILSNHFHLILRSRPDVVETWDDTEVARRWLTLCPLRKDSSGNAEIPNESELNSIRNNPARLKELRSRLSNISWWMRLLTQPFAAWANKCEGETGRFFQGRFRAIRLCDEAAILACSAYVDLNPIRAALAETLEDSEHTSVQRRIQSLVSPAELGQSSSQSSKAEGRSTTFKPDRHLAPLSIDELRDSIGAIPSQTNYRASDKGFLAMTVIEYLNLLDWTARQIVPGKASYRTDAAPPILELLGLDTDAWCLLVKDFGRMFYLVAGLPSTVVNTLSKRSNRRFRSPRRLSSITGIAKISTPANC
jgi:hypothetical protein